MNQAVSDTNVLLDTAISPTLWLIPSSMIILKNPIQGYNNKLKVSTPDMFFGINSNLNYDGKEEEKFPLLKKQQLSDERKKSPVKKISSSSSSERENLIILTLALVGGVLFSKYIF